MVEVSKYGDVGIAFTSGGSTFAEGLIDGAWVLR